MQVRNVDNEEMKLTCNSGFQRIEKYHGQSLNDQIKWMGLFTSFALCVVAVKICHGLLRATGSIQVTTVVQRVQRYIPSIKSDE